MNKKYIFLLIFVLWYIKTSADDCLPVQELTSKEVFVKGKKLIIGSLIGQGGIGSIYILKDPKKGVARKKRRKRRKKRKWILKEFQRLKSRDEAYKLIMDEIFIHKILKYLGINTIENTTMDDSNCYVIKPFIKGKELWDYIKAGEIPQNHKLKNKFEKLLRQITRQNKVFFQDFSLHNIMYSDDRKEWLVIDAEIRQTRTENELVKEGNIKNYLYEITQRKRRLQEEAIEMREEIKELKRKIDKMKELGEEISAKIKTEQDPDHKKILENKIKIINVRVKSKEWDIERKENNIKYAENYQPENMKRLTHKALWKRLLDFPPSGCDTINCRVYAEYIKKICHRYSIAADCPKWE